MSADGGTPGDGVAFDTPSMSVPHWPPTRSSPRGERAPFSFGPTQVRVIAMNTVPWPTRVESGVNNVAGRHATAHRGVGGAGADKQGQTRAASRGSPPSVTIGGRGYHRVFFRTAVGPSPTPFVREKTRVIIFDASSYFL